MAERSSITQGVQFGTETTPGTNVAANKKFNSIGVGPAINVDMQRFRSMGNKYATVVTPGKEMVEADIDGVGSYSELIWFFASNIVAPGAPVTVDTTARQWDFVSATSAEDTIKSYTVEQGGTVRAHKFNYGIVPELELTFNRDGIEVGGSMLGQRLSDGITMTASPTTPPEIPILPTDIDVFLDTTSAGLGTTKLTRVLEASWKLGDRFNPVWVLNTANNSFVAHVESEPTAELTLKMEADAAGMAQLTQLRAGSTRYVRIKGTSPTLAGASTAFYSLTLDSAAKVKDVSDFTDEDGVYAIEWTFDMVHDSGWGTGKAFTAQVVNKETTL